MNLFKKVKQPKERGDGGGGGGSMLQSGEGLPGIGAGGSGENSKVNSFKAWQAKSQKETA